MGNTIKLGNVIKIKHGETIPTSQNIGEYEFGYCTNNQIIYFNNNNNIVPIGSNYILKYVDNLSEATEEGVVYIVPNIGDTQSQTYNVSSVAPNDTSKLWIDTSSNYPLLKFYDTSSGTWKNIASIWS